MKNIKQNHLFKSIVINLERLKNDKHTSLESSKDFYHFIIKTLNNLYTLLTQTLKEDIILNNSIELESFTEQEYKQSHRAHFKKALAMMTNKAHLNKKEWQSISQKERAFRMLAEYVRQNFKSLLYKKQISEILAKYDFNIKNEKDNINNLTLIREELTQLNLFPTQMEMNNICKSKKI